MCLILDYDSFHYAYTRRQTTINTTRCFVIAAPIEYCATSHRSQHILGVQLNRA